MCIVVDVVNQNHVRIVMCIVVDVVAESHHQVESNLEPNKWNQQVDTDC